MKHPLYLVAALFATISATNLAIGYTATEKPHAVYAKDLKISNIDFSHQHIDNLVLYDLTIPGNNATAHAATMCNFTGTTLSTFTTMVKINDVIYDIKIPKAVALTVCGQRGA